MVCVRRGGAAQRNHRGDEVRTPLASDVLAAKNLPGAPLGHGHHLTQEEAGPGEGQSHYHERRHQSVKRDPSRLGREDLSVLRHGVGGEHRSDQRGDREGPEDELTAAEEPEEEEPEEQPTPAEEPEEQPTPAEESEEEEPEEQPTPAEESEE